MHGCHDSCTLYWQVFCKTYSAFAFTIQIRIALQDPVDILYTSCHSFTDTDTVLAGGRDTCAWRAALVDARLGLLASLLASWLLVSFLFRLVFGPPPAFSIFRPPAPPESACLPLLPRMLPLS